VHAGGDDRSPLAGLSGCVNIFNLVPPSENSLNEAMGPAFAASRVEHISDLHAKCTLRPHYVWKYGRHPICGR